MYHSKSYLLIKVSEARLDTSSLTNAGIILARKTLSSLETVRERFNESFSQFIQNLANSLFQEHGLPRASRGFDPFQLLRNGGILPICSEELRLLEPDSLELAYKNIEFPIKAKLSKLKPFDYALV